MYAMYARRCELNVLTSGTRGRRLRGYLVSFARCPWVETDLAAGYEYRIPTYRLAPRAYGNRVGLTVPRGGRPMASGPLSGQEDDRSLAGLRGEAHDSGVGPNRAR